MSEQNEIAASGVVGRKMSMALSVRVRCGATPVLDIQATVDDVDDVAGCGASFARVINACWDLAAGLDIGRDDPSGPSYVTAIENAWAAEAQGEPFCRCCGGTAIRDGVCQHCALETVCLSDDEGEL